MWRVLFWLSAAALAVPALTLTVPGPSTPTTAR